MVSVRAARRGSVQPGRPRQRRGGGILASSRLAGRPLQLRPAPRCSQAWSLARFGGDRPGREDLGSGLLVRAWRGRLEVACWVLGDSW